MNYAATVPHIPNVAEYTPAPLRFEGIARYAVSPERLFSAVSEPGAMQTWLPMLKSLHMDHERSREGGQACGVGSVRGCSFAMMGDVAEKIVWWDPPHGYAFEFAPKNKMMMPTKNHLVVFLTESDGKGGSVFTFRTYFEWRGAIMRHMAIHMMPMLLNRALDNLRRQLGGPGGKMRRVG